MITRRASLHTFWIIRVLADRGRTDDAFRAYAYFRWVDDWLDGQARPASERTAFVDRQQRLTEACFDGGPSGHVTPQEQMLVQLVRNHPNPDGPVAAYVRNMMDVMAFDAQRRGRLIMAAELARYQHSLAVAVTEAMHYFISCAHPTPCTEDRYRAVIGAHIAHMLRDTLDDVFAGYFNVPVEHLYAHGIGPLDYQSGPYRDWVKTRVQEARECLKAGIQYLHHVPSVRFRLAVRLYTARFTKVLDRMERNGFQVALAHHPALQGFVDWHSPRRVFPPPLK